MFRLGLVIAAFLSTVPMGPALDSLIKSYPDHLVKHDGSAIWWRDGTRMPVESGRVHNTFEDLLRDPGVRDQFLIPYRLGPLDHTPVVDEDPGRIRNTAFFLKMYGDCRTSGVQKQLARVRWLPHRGGRPLLVTRINGVAEKLALISDELEVTLPASQVRFVVPSAGAYNCRNIAGTDRPSMHAFGAAVDINVAFGSYWRWSGNRPTGPWSHDRIPSEIIRIFERHGFIWGGKWYHHDTIHFEYRPELIELARRGWR